MLGVNLVLKKVLSAPAPQNGDTRLEIKCMRKTASWSIFSGVNRHSSCGDRVARVKPGPPTYLCLLGQEVTFEEENDDHMESIPFTNVPQPHYLELTKESPESGHILAISTYNKSRRQKERCEGI